MNTLTQLLFPLAGMFVVASVVGVGCYYAISSIKDKNPLLIGFWVFMMVSLAAPLVKSQVAYAGLVFVLVIATAGATADKYVSAKPESFLFHLWRMLLAMFFSLFIGSLLFGVFLLFAGLFLSGWSVEQHDKELLLYFYGLATWPAIPPVLLLLLRTSKLRPGIDRHFEPKEVSGSDG